MKGKVHEMSNWRPTTPVRRKRAQEAKISAIILALTLPVLVALCVQTDGDGDRRDARSFATASDARAQREFSKSNFVRDTYVSPGYMNLGVSRGEKVWTSGTFARWACGVLSRNGSKLARVRFYDVEKVVHQRVSVRSAEIVSFYCQK